MSLNTIKEAIEDIKNWKVVIVVDNEDRENEWDLVAAWEAITADIINFMIKEARWLVCTPVSMEIANRLRFNPMVENSSFDTCNFTVSVDAKDDSDTGISPEDRAITVKKIVDKNSTFEDFIRPWHTFPLIARDWWVLERMWHTEASVDLALLAWFSPIAVICEIINDDWTMARVPDLIKFAKKWNLKIVSIDDLIDYRKANA